MASLSSDRIDLRISKEQKVFFKHAAELRGFKSLSEFVVHCVFTESNKIVKENDLVVKTLEDKEKFLRAILSPPPPNDNLREAQARYKNVIASNVADHSATE